MPGVSPDVTTSTDVEHLDVELKELATNSISLVPDHSDSRAEQTGGAIPVAGFVVVVAILVLSIYFAVRYLF